MEKITPEKIPTRKKSPGEQKNTHGM